MLSLDAQHNLLLEQLDVKSAFLYTKIENEMFKEQPEAFGKVAEDGTKFVCKLKKFDIWSKASQQNLIWST